LNDRGDDSPEGEMHDGILDQLAKFERAKTVERTRRGKLRKAQEGKVVGTGRAAYGFYYADDHYHIDPERMPYVHMIFERVGAGHTMYSIAQHLNEIGAPSPGNGKWHGTTIRKMILNDTYTGILWWGRERVTTTMVSKVENGERTYKKKVLRESRPRSEWIEIPVPDSGISPEIVRRAREAIEGNIKAVSKNSDRTWELSGGVAMCSECGKRMVAHTTLNSKKKPYFYYVCSNRQRKSSNCSNRKHYRTGDLEMQVTDALVDTFRRERWESFVNDMCDRELADLRRSHRSDPEKTKENLAGRIKTLETKMTRLVDLFTDGDISKETYREKKSSIQEEIEVLRQGFSKVEALDDEIRRVEVIRYTLLNIENPLSGHYTLIDLPSDKDVVIDEDLFYGDGEMAARRRQIFYRNTEMKVKVGEEELEISLGLGETLVSKNGTPSG
jgi:site-specific DNA recombinase